MTTRLPFRARIAQAILGTKLKEFIPSLASQDPFMGGMGGGRLNSYSSKPDQLSANIGWCFTANNAIAEPTAAIELELYKRKGKGTGRQGKARERITEHEILVRQPHLSGIASSMGL